MRLDVMIDVFGRSLNGQEVTRAAQRGSDGAPSADFEARTFCASIQHLLMNLHCRQEKPSACLPKASPQIRIPG
jgi:hypothetical protein